MVQGEDCYPPDDHIKQKHDAIQEQKMLNWPKETFFN